MCILFNFVQIGQINEVLIRTQNNVIYNMSIITLTRILYYKTNKVISKAWLP